MKMKKRILSVLVCLMLATLAAITVFATEETEYTGTVDGAYTQLGNVDTKPNLSDKIKSIDKVTEYLATVDPEAEGYAELTAAIDIKEIEIAELLLAEGAVLPTAAERHASLDELTLYLTAHPFVDNASEGERFEDKLNIEKTAIAETYLAESVAASSADAKHTALNGLQEFEAAYDVAESETYTKAAVELQNFETAKLYLNGIDTTAGTASFGAAIRKLNGFVKDHTFPNTVDGYVAFINDYNTSNNAFKKAYANAKADAQTRAELSDWDTQPIINLDFTSASGVAENTVGQLVAEKNMNGTEQLSFIGEEYGMDGDNGYYTVKYELSKNHFRTNANITGIVGSAVFECDFTTFGKLPNYGQSGKLIWFENGTGMANDKSWSQVYISINSNGDIVKGTNSTSVLVKEAVTPGEWVHISLVMDLVSNDVDVYVDYELVGSFSLAHSEGYTSDFARIRIGCNPDLAGGEFSLDNVLLYQGNAPRDLDYFKNATDDQKFVLYASQVLNTKISRTARKDYYDAASRLLENYYDGANYLTNNTELRNAVDTVLNFDAESLTADIMEENLQKLKELETKLKSISRGESTYQDRVYFINKADEFILSTGGLIGDFTDISTYLTGLRNQIAEEDMITEFVGYVNNFYSASNVNTMQIAYDSATQLYKNLNTELASSSGFPAYAAAYAKYKDMGALLFDYRIVDNSKMLLACLQFIIDYDTPEEWEENYDLVVSYVTLAGDIIDSGIYDIYYKNTGDLIERFMPMYDYFNVRVQEKHIEYISSELEKCDSLPFSRYFEKYGICLKLRDYVETSRIDYGNEELVALIEKLNNNITTLEGQRGEYEDLLEENTQVFIEKCKGLVGSIGYAEMKVICEEARIYFYTMNVQDASAQDAISIYTARCNEIETVEAHAEGFINSVLYLATPEIDLPAAIVKAASYLDKLEHDVDGVALAYEQFERICAEYDASVADANDELAATVEISCGMANGDKLGGLIAMVLKALLG